MDGGEKRIFYGWIVVAVCFVVNFVVFGIAINTFTVYVKPIQAEMGWSRGDISLGMSLGGLAMALSAPFMGSLIDRVGARVIMAVGAVVVGLGSVLISQAQSLPYFYAVYFGSGIGQAGATIIPISLVISNWFKVQRGRALGFVMTGTGLGAMVMVPVSSWVVITWGWRTSLFVMGCAIMLVAPLVLLFVRTHPSEKGLVADGGEVSEEEPPPETGLSIPEAVRTPAFWLIGCMMLLAAMLGMGLGVHLMPYLTDVGHTVATASLIIAIVSGLTVAGKIVMGFVTDRWGVRRAVALAFGTIAIGIFLLMDAEAFLAACIFGVVYGLGIGAPLVLNPALTAECMGLKHFGAVFGALTLLTALGAAAGPPILGYIYDAAGTYTPAFILFIVLTLVAGASGMLARRAVA
jgi:sugar phosphate permease